MSDKTSDAVLAIIFIITLVLAGSIHSGLKKPLTAKYVLGVAALILTAVTYVLDSGTVPACLLALAGVFILLDARFAKNSVR